MANSAAPDQLASSEANWSGSTLFAKAGHIRFSRTRVKKDKAETKEKPGFVAQLLVHQTADPGVKSSNASLLA